MFTRLYEYLQTTGVFDTLVDLFDTLFTKSLFEVISDLLEDRPVLAKLLVELSETFPVLDNDTVFDFLLSSCLTLVIAYTLVKWLVGIVTGS